MNNFNNQMYGQQFGAGVQYQAMPQAKMTQPLTKEQIQELRKKTGGFTLNIPDIEFDRAKCTHKEDGTITLNENIDGTVTCTICQETFRLVDYDYNAAADVVQNFVDLFQSIKTYYVNVPEVYIKAIADILPIVKQIPELYKIAQQDFLRYENGYNIGQRNQMGGFNLLNSLMSPQQYGYGQAPQQQYAQPQYGYGQQPQYGYGQAPQQQQPSNGFGYNAGTGNRPIVDNQMNTNQTVDGGNGNSYTKQNSVPVKQPTSDKVFNA